MMGIPAFRSVKFENYERELKYLVHVNSLLDINVVVNLFQSDGFVLVSELQREKHEIYYDDDKFTLTRRGEVMRSSSYITENATGLMYKKNISDPSKPYVTKLEMGSTTYKEMKEFLKLFGLEFRIALRPVITARMIRNVVIMSRKNDSIYISFDKVRYAYVESCGEEVYEEMLEIEDWKKPNTLNVDTSYDQHLLGADKLIRSSSLPLIPTKHTKSMRGYLLLTPHVYGRKN